MMEYSEIFKIIMTVTVSSLTGSFITYLIATPKKYKEERKTEIKDIKDRLVKSEEQIDNRLAIIEENQQALTRSELQQRVYEVEQRGFMSSYEMQNINYLYDSYKKLHGNSYVHELISRVQKLPIKDVG